MITIDCVYCKGKGIDNTGWSSKTCPVCKGRKENHILFENPKECNSCSGKGFDITSFKAKPCKKCNGVGVMR